jgi:hypothetical protein
MSSPRSNLPQSAAARNPTRIEAEAPYRKFGAMVIRD